MYRGNVAPTHGPLSVLVGEMLRDRMRSRDLSQTAVAALVGVPQPSLSRALSGDSKWDLDVFQRVCIALGTRSSDLLAVAEDTLGER